MLTRVRNYRHGMKLKSLFLVLVAFAMMVIPTPAAHAQANNERESITLSPTSRKYTIDAGKTIEDELTVVNDGSTDYDFLVYARPYSIDNNQYDSPDFTTATKNSDLYGWVQFPETKYHIKAGATEYIKFSVHVPEGVAPGGHYGVIFAEVQPPADQKVSGNSVIRKKRVGTIIYATVNGKVTLDGDATGSSIPFWQLQPPLTTTVDVKNTGNTHFTDAVTLTVRDTLGNVKHRSVASYEVLPGTTRTIDRQWQSAPWFGLYKVEIEQKFLDKTIRSDGYVLMMPRYLPIALVIIVFIGGVYAVTRRRKK